MTKLSDYFKEYQLAFRSGIGRWAFFLHKVTGIILTFYLLFHIFIIILYAKNPAVFSSLIGFLFRPFLVLPLLAVVLYHGLNGIRILLFDLGLGIRIQKLIFMILMGLGFILWVIASGVLYR